MKKAHDALNAVGLDESFYTRSPFELSGGEKRRVAVAGILAMQPKYLVVDEPTAGLDPSGADEMMALFQTIHSHGTTLVLVTHDMDLILPYCTDVIVLDHGKVAKTCKPKDLFQEEVERYSLHTPALVSFANALEKRGYAFDKEKLTNVRELAHQIALGRKK